MSAEWCEPREDCPECGAGLLIERFEDTARSHAPVRFCSYVTCEWSDHPELSPDCCPIPPKPDDPVCADEHYPVPPVSEEST